MLTRLIYLCGLPRSGKSTLADYLLNKPRELTKLGVDLGKGPVVVNVDDIRLSLTGKRFVLDAEPQVFFVKYKMIDTLYRTGYCPIVDETHSSMPSILPLLNIDPNALMIKLWANINDCKERAVKTEQEDLLPVIDRIYKNLATFNYSKIPQAAHVRWTGSKYEIRKSS